MTDPGDPWRRAVRALALLAVAGPDLKGMVLRDRAGPVRQKFEHLLARLPGPLVRIHPGISDLQLFGGLDIAATMARGSARQNAGIAATPALLVLPMAERTPPGLAARLAQLLDAGRGHRLVLLDEGAEPEEAAPACLRDRLAFDIDLNGVGWTSARASPPAPADLDAARHSVSGVTLGPDHLSQLVAIAARFGIDSLRAPVLAARAARALAALDGRAEVSDDNLRDAATLVYASRALRPPDLPDPETESRPDPSHQGDKGDSDATGKNLPMEDALIEAISAWVPSDILDRPRRDAKRPAAASGSGAGTRRKGNRRGRPLPSRPGRPDGRARIDIPATLLAAAPLQRLRAAPNGKILILPSDIRLRRFEDRSDRLVIFAVDASGSAALARMAEAKGAVETMLARAYAKRDVVALIAFRKTGAEVLLPPTRSLVLAKRRLAALPGGGGTPLAAGLLATAEVASHGLSRGLSPVFVILTDGRANITLDGKPGRPEAMEDARTAATVLVRQSLPGVVIDTAARPGDEGVRLAGWLGAQYLALPRADAPAISFAADAALGT